MRKIIAALMALCLLLGTVPAFAQEDEAAALVLAEAEKVLQDMLAQATGWEKLLLEKAQIVEAVRDGKVVRVKIDVPKLGSGAGEHDRARTGAEAYLDKALAPYFSPKNAATLQFSATCAEKDGALTVKWGSSNPKGLQSKVHSMARNAWQSYQNNEVRQALNAILLPEATRFPKRKPEETPAMDSLAAYTAQVAPALGLTAEQAEQRLPSLMMLMDFTKLDFSGGMDAAGLTVRLRNWEDMLQTAADMAREAMPAITGLPEMDSLGLEKILCQWLPAACMETWYQQKGTTSRKLTVNVAAAITDGPQAADGLMEFFGEYNAALDRHVAELAVYAKTLPYYPPVMLIDTQLLTGADDPTGAPVTFDTDDSQHHGYVCVSQNGEPVLSGFIHSGVRLMTRLAPGSYQVYCTTGPEWFGDVNLFGREAFFGSFDLTVESGDKIIIHMEDEGGNLPVNSMPEADFRKAIGQK